MLQIWNFGYVLESALSLPLFLLSALFPWLCLPSTSVPGFSHAADDGDSTRMVSDNLTLFWEYSRNMKIDKRRPKKKRYFQIAHHSNHAFISDWPIWKCSLMNTSTITEAYVPDLIPWSTAGLILVSHLFIRKYLLTKLGPAPVSTMVLTGSRVF